jgi:hypothetical protein
MKAFSIRGARAANGTFAILLARLLPALSMRGMLASIAMPPDESYARRAQASGAVLPPAGPASVLPAPRA